MSELRQVFEAWARNNGYDDAAFQWLGVPGALIDRDFLVWSAGLRAGMERAEHVVGDVMMESPSSVDCHEAIRAELSALDADSSAVSGPKIDDKGVSGARVAQGGERAEKTAQIADEFLDQPEPVKNDHPAVWDLVVEDMRRRDHVGLQRYGTRLQPHNGRDALKDAYAEILDLAVYLRQEICEQEGI